MRQARCADCSPRFHREAESRPQFCLGAHAAASDLMASMVTVRARAAKTLAEVKVMALSALGRARTLSRSMAAVQPTARSPTKPTAALEDQAEHQELHEGINRGALWGFQTRPLVLTWAFIRPAHNLPSGAQPRTRLPGAFGAPAMRRGLARCHPAG